MGNARNIAFWVILFLLILALFNLFSGNQSSVNARSVAYSDFISQVEQGSVSTATIDGEAVQFTTSEGTFETTRSPKEIELSPTNPALTYQSHGLIELRNDGLSCRSKVVRPDYSTTC